MFLYRLIQKLKVIKRCNEILLVFFRAGFSVGLEKVGLYRLIHPLHKIGGSVSVPQKELPAKLRQAFVTLGPVFVKFGQILSTRSDILPQEYITELEKLQSTVPPFSFSEAEIILEDNLKQPLHKTFKQFSHTPFASASLGQVYKATLHNGTVVAVKVQRPKAKDQIKLDTEVLLTIAHWVDNNFPEAKGLNLIGLIQEFRRWTLNELDYRKEATNCEIFSNFFKDDPNIFGPKVYWEYSSESVLTLEYINGISLGNIINQPQLIKVNTRLRQGFVGLSTTKSFKVDKKKLAHEIADSFIRQFFEYGYFHADPHPGNIFILPDGKITFLDFGMVGFLDDRLTSLASAMFVALMQKDIETLVGLLMQLEEKYDDQISPKRIINANGLRKELNQLVLQWPESGQAGKFTQLLSQLLMTAIKNGINVPTDLSMLAKSIVTLDIVVKQLDPDFQMEKWEQPMVEKIINKKLQGKNLKSSAKTAAFVLEDLLKRLPESTATIVDNLENGRFGMETNSGQLLEYQRLLNANSKINNYGTLLAAIIIASALIYKIPGQPELWGLSIAQIGLYGSLILLIMFMLGNTTRTQ